MARRPINRPWLESCYRASVPAALVVRGWKVATEAGVPALQELLPVAGKLLQRQTSGLQNSSVAGKLLRRLASGLRCRFRGWKVAARGWPSADRGTFAITCATRPARPRPSTDGLGARVGGSAQSQLKSRPDVGAVEAETFGQQPLGQDVHVPEQLVGKLAEGGANGETGGPEYRRATQQPSEGLGELGVRCRLRDCHVVSARKSTCCSLPRAGHEDSRAG